MEQLAELVRIRLGARDTTYRLASRQGECHLQPSEADSIAAPALLANGIPYPPVGTATLELAPLPLHQQIQHFARQAQGAGCHRIQLLPLFLLPGVHVMEDIPQEVTVAQKQLGEDVILDLGLHLGAYSRLAHLWVNSQKITGTDAKILLSHGTRRPGGNQPVDAVAQQLGAVAAYWSVQPTLVEQVRDLAAVGHEQIVILPYFIFAGGITDAIAHTVADLQKQFPDLRLQLGQPIGATPQLADLIVNVTEKL
ncbi:sirohydrochlorin chelatase [Coleofasciculus sp. LEGE 07092]|nr:sirohydrochlorin chelatase [Coleofasciculus sp. LEGE 07081]MBE9152191.1 sirohydrochlorin chelatase [Coleofasciculus sp. LEGE 07092]